MSSYKKSETGRERPPDKIKLTPLAQRDLEAIYLYGLQHFNEESANTYLETIEHAFTVIRHNKIGIYFMNTENTNIRASLLSYRNSKLLSDGADKISIIEFVIYSDSKFTSHILDEKAYSFLNMLPLSVDDIAPSITIRANWSVDGNKTIFSGIEPYTTDFHGGWFTDEIAALISLKLGVRAHAGTVTREYNDRTPEHGFPRAEQNPPPHFLTKKKSLIVPSCKKSISLEELKKINNIHHLDESDFNHLIRAARSFQDSLWICESSPNLAWLLMVSALETAAQQWDRSKGNSIEKFKQSKPNLFDKLNNDQYKELIPIISEEFSSTFGAGRKFRDFCIKFIPDEPKERPEHGRIKWKKQELKDIFIKVYELRSTALHTGQPFPAPMCSTPDNYFGLSEQAVTGLASSTLGGTWTPKEAPINLNIFFHMTHSILNKWWDSLYLPN
ncbi:type II toxin-antitoxin system RelE/ParE family toxin [Pectobacterium versatile]|uniref:type II toxin-antitoxin system RelE/ParE family toxin n=1 Tax=Pectobacterium versatile TaxID=2488639 RepID=UPI001F0000BA|nr:type II toxin-antitoxin system RelE/ParE family toxin [Pectobacterium versatile]